VVCLHPLSAHMYIHPFHDSFANVPIIKPGSSLRCILLSLDVSYNSPPSCPFTFFPQLLPSVSFLMMWAYRLGLLSMYHIGAYTPRLFSQCLIEGWHYYFRVPGIVAWCVTVCGVFRFSIHIDLFSHNVIDGIISQ